MNESVLFQNSSKSTTVLDLPGSIAHGQGTSACPVSSAVPASPYPSIEPKGSKRARLLNQIPDDERDYHQGICEVLRTALREARLAIGDREWCCPRREWSVADEIEGMTDDGIARPQLPTEPPLLLSAFQNYLPDRDVFRHSLIVNPLHAATVVTVDADLFHVPSRSTFICSTIADGIPIVRNAMTSTLLHAGLQSREMLFDFVLLDPPWSNRSARRARRYKTAETQPEDPFDEVLPILRSYLAPDGIVAIWITNKAAVRSRVLHRMEGMKLFEEWIWLKVTEKGDPVCQLDGIWRKPYEILFLFTRAPVTPSSIQRRVLITVPDLHSRKPCLKGLIEPMLPKRYRGLEVFARSLTAGWWSWGDECLKFQRAIWWD